MNKIILADSQAIFLAGVARILATEEDMRIIAQCTHVDVMLKAISTFKGAIVVFASSLLPDLTRVRMLLETTGSRGIVFAENNESATAYFNQGFAGVVFRSVNGPTLIECVRRVAAGETWFPIQLMQPDLQQDDKVASRPRQPSAERNALRSLESLWRDSRLRQKSKAS